MDGCTKINGFLKLSDRTSIYVDSNREFNVSKKKIMPLDVYGVLTGKKTIITNDTASAIEIINLERNIEKKTFFER